MGFGENQHVTRMARHLPLGAAADQLFDEYTTADETWIPTAAFEFLRNSLRENRWDLMVLTGDAGHGKTSMCRHLLQDLGQSDQQARESLAERGDGMTGVESIAGRELRVLKDLSERSLDEGVQALLGALEGDGVQLVACANEGRLRNVIHAASDGSLRAVQMALDASVEQGVIELGHRIALLNLNFQAVTGPPRNIADQVMRDWASEEDRWTTCDSCDARPLCPIYENHRLLADPNAAGHLRRERIGLALRSAEMLSDGFTIRDLLMVSAMTITGGLTCSEVARRVQDAPADKSWQFQHLFHQALFGLELTKEARDAIRPLSMVGMLDPGRAALRAVDEMLLPASKPLDEVHPADPRERFLPPDALDEVGVPFRRADATKIEERHRRVVRYLRRSQFFASEEPGLEELGLRHARRFVDLLADLLSTDDRRAVRDQLLAGLEAIQGLRVAANHAGLFILEPAFGSGYTPVLSSEVGVNGVSVSTRREYWLGRDGGQIASGVDWLEKELILTLTLDGGDAVDLSIDLLTFEFLLRTAEGMDARQFFQAHTRRLLASLARLAHTTGVNETVVFKEEGMSSRLILDEGLIRTLD